MKWYIKVIKNYFVIEGRSHRTEYWMFFLFSMIFAIVLGIISGILDGITNTDQSTVLGNIYSLFLFIPSITVGIRRMHDTNHSGWWLIVPIISLIFLVQKGTEGQNKFGYPPKL